MNKLYEMNYAGCHMKVGSLEIIGDLTGKGAKAIRKGVEALQEQTRQFNMKQENYWSNLASDGVITPYEKKTLYKEYKEIEQSYTSLLNEAVKQGLEGTAYFIAYTKAYEDLHKYLFITLSLFNDMNSDTNIPDREVFDRQFSEYYGSEKFTTLALATGIMGNLGFRVLTSLDEPGTENEIGLYKGTIYQYTGGKWLAVGLEGYMGVKNELPNASLNQYFMVGETFLVLQQLIVNDEKLLVNDDQELFVNQEFQEGFIYVKEGDYWKKVSDTTDYRYVVAMIDLVTITGQLPGVFQEAIDKATENLLDHLPAYLGPKTAFPQTALEGDFFVYSGPTYGSHIQSDVYRWEQGQWVHLDPKDSVNGDIYMRCLDDILSINNAGSASFASVFANAFWAHSITTEKLSTRTLYLKEGGYIQSYNTYWDYHHAGLRIDSNGDIDANGDTHIGGTCSIDGTASIGGNTTIGGTCKITGNTTVSGNIDINGKGTIGNDMTVTGNIDTDGSLTVKGTTNISGNTTIGGNVDINGKGTIGSDIAVNGDISGSKGTFSGYVQSTNYNEREGTGYRLEPVTGRIRAQALYVNRIANLTNEAIEFDGFPLFQYPVIQKALMRRYTNMDDIARNAIVLTFPGDTIRVNGYLFIGTTQYALYGIRGIDPNNCVFTTLSGDITLSKSGGYWKRGNDIIGNVVCVI